MRIISGLYKGRVLKSPSNSKTRPTSDRLRETLFNILSPRIDEDTRFLDLCAGTGAVGIEALSRGCKSADFVDVSRKACALIEENLDLFSVPEDQTNVHCAYAEKFIVKNQASEWDVLFFDPPYDSDYSKALVRIAESKEGVLSEDGVLIVEHFSKKILPDEIAEIRRWRIVKQGDSYLSFYEKT